MTTPLNRANADVPRSAPARLVHLGLGAFHRAHQIWYTQNAETNPDQPEWGYVSFTGRGTGVADALAPQDGLYTLVTRSGDGDSPELITSLVEAQPASNLVRLVELMADPQVAVVSMTVTEAGYHLNAADELDTGGADVQQDIAALTSAQGDTRVEELATAAGRIVYGLAARRAAGVGGLAVMSCDNIAANGDTTRASILGMADQVDRDLAAWIRENVTFPSTSIDRITPATEAALITEVEAQTGFHDAAPVVTEPFASWIIEGDFPAGRPAWENAGVQFVDDIEQFERRKLWLLNGSHSLMAYFGQLRGHATVADAITDPECRARVESLWDEAANHLTTAGLNVPDYREQLIERFENPRIVHNLAQIAIDGGTKQRMRAVPILKAELDAGRDGGGASFSIAAWIAFVLTTGEIRDTRIAEITAAKEAADPVAALVAVLDEQLSTDTEVVERIRALVTELS
ncbi:Mannitol 2-dehydrogenase [Corynebacterium faecale]|uniref:mannitol dehydrogenase family protein n=1 Tax=Corynebacterium faecale TaxID=1758466 RepID=UPI0025B37592|nr:mannitol dehydrogenase family protein [Corynebacterium faecale]WJY92979.1 Mannitol 2-dehydrogenase [Corynebacterium faecale]